jgi:5'-nucleotidase
LVHSSLGFRAKAIVFAFLLIAPASLGAQEKLTILISNDDGFMAPGLTALVRAFQPIANIVVAAPAVQQSGAGHGITYREPLMVRTVHESDTLKWYAITARPASTVRLALDELVDVRPDVVISGINTSPNLASGTWVSGTLGAAREAAIDGITSLATSLQDGGSNGPAEHYDAAAMIIRGIVERLRDSGELDRGLFLNINVPRNPADGIEGLVVVGAARRSGVQHYERRTRPLGSTYFWDTWVEKDDDEEGTDIHALAEGYVTITPLITNQTAVDLMDSVQHLTSQ